MTDPNIINSLLKSHSKCHDVVLDACNIILDQQGEIKQLKDSIEHLVADVNETEAALVSAKKQITRQQAEIEQLHKQREFRREYLGYFPKLERAEAVREFAERLKNTKFKHGNDYIIYAENIDNIVKEMEKRNYDEM